MLQSSVTYPSPKHQSEQVLPSIYSLPQNKSSTFKEFLRITNRQTKYQLSHGDQFKHLLEPRDQVLQHQFNISEEINQKEINQEGYGFTGSHLYKSILQKIKKYLVQSVSNVVSVAFNFLCKGELGQNQAKEYASKNMMLNIHSIVRESIKALEQNQLISKKINVKDLQSFLIIQVDNIINNILINLADSYPQAPPSGSTPRMRDAITQVNRISDEQNDFIFTSKIKISDYLKIRKGESDREELILEDQTDYTSFIMKVINAVISSSQSIEQDSRQRTASQMFTTFNQQLFWISQEKSYQEILKENGEKNKKQHFQKSLVRDDLKKTVCNLFDTILETDQEKINQLQKMLGIQREQESISLQFSRPQKRDQSLQLQELKRLWQAAEEGIEEMKRGKNFGLGQKIPNSVRPFSRQEIANKQFTARHSSILRILTKWASYLEEMFKNSEAMIRQKLYPFKNVHNQLLNIKNNDSQGVSKLIKQLNEQYQEVKKKFQAILKNSYAFMGKFLSSKSESIASSVSRYTSTRQISSKINVVLTSLMLSYTNILIHHLLKAGQDIYTDQKYQNLNLVVFRVNDLMRSKLQCTESSFINILKTMYMFDSSQTMQGKFKIIRIKNKLDDPANNIIINYLFMGRVQCQLQLSIQEAKGKEKNYFMFSHFVYELTRGKFGSIAECAIMISQLDPMITACKSNCYQQKQTTIQLANSKLYESNLFASGTYDLRMSHNSSQFLKQIKYSLFQCIECSKLIANQNSDVFPSDTNCKTCYKCVIQKKDFEQYLNNWWQQPFKKISDKRIMNYHTLKQLKDEKCLVELSTSGQIYLSAVVYIQKQYRTFALKIDSKILQQIDSQVFDFGLMEYIDTNKKIKKKKNSSVPAVLAYLFDNIQSIPEDILAFMKLNRDVLQSKFNKLVNLFKQFRQEKNIVKTIKYKAEIIKANRDEWNIMNKVCNNLVLGQNRMEEKHVLKYNKYRHLDLSNLKQITATKTGLKEISKWMKQCHNLKILDLNWNSIEQINNQFLPPFLNRLSLNYNKLKSIDLSDLHTLTQLQLNRNQLTHFQLGNNTKLIQLDLNRNKITQLNLNNNKSLKILRMGYNSVEQIKYLPTSLEKLEADRRTVVNFDFKDLKRLKLLWIFNGKAKRQDIVNLAGRTELHNWA